MGITRTGGLEQRGNPHLSVSSQKRDSTLFLFHSHLTCVCLLVGFSSKYIKDFAGFDLSVVLFRFCL